MDWLIINLEAPLVSYGGTKVDYDGPTERLPTLSAITGLLANALGYDRAETDRLAALQDHLIVASRETAQGEMINDFHTALISKSDRGWTRYGVESRAGGPDTYAAPLVQNKSYLADGGHLCVVGLLDGAPVSLSDLSEALDSPARPLFIGRKCCLPSGRLYGGMIDAENALAALIKTCDGERQMRACWPVFSGGEAAADRIQIVSDRRNWLTDRHSGGSKIAFGRVFGEKQ